MSGLKVNRFSALAFEQEISRWNRKQRNKLQIQFTGKGTTKIFRRSTSKPVNAGNHTPINGATTKENHQ